jgi:putative transposase
VSTATASYTGHRYPVEIINHCVWLYFRFSLSFREVEELMLARGVAVSYESRLTAKATRIAGFPWSGP